MLTAYIKAALRKAHYKILPDGEGYFGTIEGLQGVWANAETGKHQFMVRGGLRVRIPNPHREDIGKNLLGEILREAGIEISA